MQPKASGRAVVASLTLAVGMLLRCSAGIAEDFKKEYWATSLAGPVDEGILQGLYDAVDRGEIGWLDIDPRYSIPPLKPGINLIFYHVGGNCYIGSDCERFPSSEPTGDRWSDSERVIDLDYPLAREIVIRDLVALVRRADEVAPYGAIVGVHIDNVHRLGAVALASLFNELLAAIEAARKQGSISKTRKVGYVAKNNPKAFQQALEQRLLEALPLYQINENARLNQDGTLDRESLIAQDIGRRCDIPIFLKTFGSDVAYTVERDDAQIDIHVSKDMAQEMAQKPNISGVAWSAEEENYHPTMFVQGSPVRQAQTRFCGK